MQKGDRSGFKDFEWIHRITRDCILGMVIKGLLSELHNPREKVLHVYKMI